MLDLKKPKHVYNPLCSTTGFGLLLTVFFTLPSFKLLQPVAGRRKLARLLPSVAICCRWLQKNILRFLSGNPSATGYRVEAQFENDSKPRFTTQTKNKI
jgi:hypothetical protein